MADAPLTPAALARRVEEVAGGLDDATRGALDSVRAAVAALATRDPAGGDVGAALADLRHLAQIDTDVPTASRRPAVRYVKGGVKAASGWYLRYVASQVTAFAGAVASLGDALSVRADALERSNAALAERVAALEARLDHLDRRP